MSAAYSFQARPSAVPPLRLRRLHRQAITRMWAGGFLCSHGKNFCPIEPLNATQLACGVLP